MKQKIELTAHFSKSGDKNSPRRIKGFASMNNRDRHDHIIPPEAFDIKRFMNNPQLKYNHQYYMDENGNKIPIGKVTEATVAMVKDIGDEIYWGIIDTATGKQIDTFEKSASPDCYHGCRGMWVVAEVTIEKVWNQILDGEFNAFSWEGFARFAQVKFAGLQRIVAKYIDWYETSCVFIPDNYAATFVLSKSGDKISKEVVDGAVFANAADPVKLAEMKPYAVHFSKEFFSTDEMATDWLYEKGMDGSVEITEENGERIATLVDDKEMTDATYTMQFATGIQLAMGFATEKVNTVSAELEVLTLTKSISEELIMGKKNEEGETKLSKAVSEVQPNGGDKVLSANPDTNNPPATRDNGGAISDSASTNGGTGSTALEVGTGTEDAPASRENGAQAGPQATPKTGEGDTTLTTETDEVPLNPAPTKGVKSIDAEESTAGVTETEVSVGEVDVPENGHSADTVNPDPVNPAPAQLGKGVQDELDGMNSTKWSRLQPIFKAMEAFDEAIWKTENIPAELQALAEEFATIVSGEARMIKTAEPKSEAQEALEMIASKSAEKVLEVVQPKLDMIDEVVTLVKSLQPKEETPAVEEEEVEDGAEVSKSAEGQTEEELVKLVKSLQGELSETKEQIAVMSKSVASPATDRTEETGAELKKSTDADPNDVFGDANEWNKAFGFKS